MLERQFARDRVGWTEEREALVERYEHHLALERGRFNRMQSELVGKICQLVKLDPPQLTAIEEDIVDPRWRPREEPLSLIDTMGQEQLESFQARKEAFWEEGEEMGFSPAAIKQRWKEIRDTVVSEITEGEIIEE